MDWLTAAGASVRAHRVLGVVVVLAAVGYGVLEWVEKLVEALSLNPWFLLLAFVTVVDAIIFVTVAAMVQESRRKRAFGWHKLVVALVFVLVVLGATGFPVYRAYAATPGAIGQSRKPEAVDFYNNALRHDLRPDVTRENLINAEALYQKAIAADSQFALAHAALSRLHSRLWHLYGDEPGRVDLARAYAEKAVRLEPELTDAHVAMGYYYYWGLRDYENALREFLIAQGKRKEDSEVNAALGYLYRRMGNWSEALRHLQLAVRYRSNDPVKLTELGYTFEAVRCYPEALEAYQRAERMDMDAYQATLAAGKLDFVWNGRVDSLSAALDRISPRHDADGDLTLARYELAMLRRQPEKALRALRLTSRARFEGSNYYYPRALLRGSAYAAAGQVDKARAAFDSALVELQAQYFDHFGEARFHAALARVYAELDDTTQATTEAMTAVGLRPLIQDHVDGPTYLTELAWVYARTGRTDQAVQRIRELLVLPSGLSRAEVIHDPQWEMLKQDSTYLALLRLRPFSLCATERALKGAPPRRGRSSPSR